MRDRMKRRAIPLAIMIATGSITAWAAPKPSEIIRDCSDCPEMVMIPAGTFVMGTIPNTDETSEHPAERELTNISIEKPFAIGRFELTRREFSRFADETGFIPTSNCRLWDSDKSGFADRPVADWRSPNFPKTPRDDHPVTCVDWYEARAYASWLSQKTGHTYRLPSEAEWEYAAKAGTQTLRFWGNNPFDGCDYANSFDQTGSDRYPLSWDAAKCRDGAADLSPVGAYQPNAFGLYDMIGNVWEWIEDCSSRSYIGRPVDQQAWVWPGCQRRIQRGGSWMTSPARSRSSYHGDGNPTDRAVFFGFRLVRELEQ